MAAEGEEEDATLNFTFEIFRSNTYNIHLKADQILETCI
jgi:hypothetical protein